MRQDKHYIIIGVRATGSRLKAFGDYSLLQGQVEDIGEHPLLVGQHKTSVCGLILCLVLLLW